MSLTRLAIERRRVTLVALAVVAAAGVSAYRGAPRAEDPGFVIRTALVRTPFPGASPERVEELVTDRLEKAIQEMPEIDSITSQSKAGVSLVFVNIEERYTEMRPIWDALRRKVDKARGDLPEGIRGPFVDDEFGDVFGTVVAITGDGFSYAELDEVADEVRDELLLVDEVAKVDVYGTQDERIFVEYSNPTLARFGLSPLQLQQILESRNIITPGGEIRTPVETLVVEPSGNFESIADLSRTVIRLPATGDLVYLGDVVSIRRGTIDPPRSKARFGGEPALILAISMREGGNILALGAEVDRTLERLRAWYPIGIELEYVQRQAAAVSRKVDDFVGSLFQAVAIVGLVMLAFLGLRTGLVVSSLIPAAMVATFLVMDVFSIGIDQMSLASLIIALGMLVDNAIVMSESILVSMQAGSEPKEAAIESAAELRVPLLTSSLTTAAAFLPIFLAESSTGEYTAPIFKVVTIALLCSWVLSLTMIPLLCVLFLRVDTGDGEGGLEGALHRRYRRWLLAALRRRGLTLAIVAAAFTVTMALFRFVPVIFFPPNDRPTFTADLELPRGTPLARTEAVVERFERHLREQLLVGPERDEGVTAWTSFIGSGGPRFILPHNPEQASPNYAFLLLEASSRDEIDRIVPALDRFARATFPDLQATIRPLALGPSPWPPIQVRISGQDPDRVFDLVEGVQEHLRSIPGTRLVDDDWGPRSKKLVVQVDQPRALRAGVTSQDVAVSLQTALSGIATTEFRENEDVIPITLRSDEASRGAARPFEIGSLDVFAQSTGRSVPLQQVADVEVRWQPAVIKRHDRRKTVTVEAATEPGTTAAEVTATLVPWLEGQAATWGPGYSWALGGEAETSGKANASIAAKLPVAGLIILLLLVGQFDSIRRPLIILITIPLGLIGVVLGLLLTRSYFGFMTLLGIISLAGIVINNAIVLLDRIRIEIEDQGLDPARAVLESAQRRLRPILLTTATTIGGLLPLWFGGGPMWEPMAIAIIFGLAFATLLTLGVVPVLYSLFFGVRFDGIEPDGPGNAGEGSDAVGPAAPGPEGATA